MIPFLPGLGILWCGTLNQKKHAVNVIKVDVLPQGMEEGVCLEDRQSYPGLYEDLIIASLEQQWLLIRVKRGEAAEILPVYMQHGRTLKPRAISG